MATNKGFEGKRSDTFVFDPDDVVIVGIDTADGPEHPLYDPRIHLPIDDGLTASILGTEERPGKVLVPILIVKYEGVVKALHGKPAVVDGRQRIRSAREAKKILAKQDGARKIAVEAKAQRGDELALMLMATTTNELRRDNDMLAKADRAVFLRSRGATIEDVALAYGVTAKAIEQWYALADGATAPVRKAVHQGQLSPTAAAKIAKLDGKEAQEEALTEVLSSGGRTTRDVKKAVAKKNGKSEEGSDGVGVGKKVQKKLLDYAIGTPNDDADPYWDGVRDVLRVILGEKAKAVAGKMKTALKKCGVEAE